MKRLLLLSITAVLVGASGLSSAQHGGGSGGGHGGGWHGGGGGWHGGGGGWHGGGGGGHGGGQWHGGDRWHGGGRGGGHFHSSAFFSLGIPWLWWGAPYYDYYAPAYYPYSYEGAYTAPNAYYIDAPGSPVYQGPSQFQSQPQSQPQAPAQNSYRWYCPDQGYYPAVQTCAQGWLRVIPDGGGPPATPQG